MKRISLAAALMALLLATAAAAVSVPAGPNFQVNQVTNLSQYQPDVAQDDAGDFAIVWSDDSAFPTAATVKIRLYAASGEATTDEIVVASTPQSSSPPRVAMTPAGEIAVVWEDHQVIYLRRFDRHGQARGETAKALGSPDLSNHSPDVGLDAAGNAFVVWAAAAFENVIIVLQRLDADEPRSVFRSSRSPPDTPTAATAASTASSPSASSPLPAVPAPPPSVSSGGSRCR
jgi:hypothetical protein